MIRVKDRQQPLADQKVTLLAWKDGEEEPVYLHSRLTNVDGRVSFRLPKPEIIPDRLEVAVANKGYRTCRAAIPIRTK